MKVAAVADPALELFPRSQKLQLGDRPHADLGRDRLPDQDRRPPPLHPPATTGKPTVGQAALRDSACQGSAATGPEAL